MEHEPTFINEVLAELASARAQLSATGAVDVETEQLRTLEHQLLSGHITPGDARVAIRKILESRNDYH